MNNLHPHFPTEQFYYIRSDIEKWKKELDSFRPKVDVTKDLNVYYDASCIFSRNILPDTIHKVISKKKADLIVVPKNITTFYEWGLYVNEQGTDIYTYRGIPDNVTIGSYSVWRVSKKTHQILEDYKSYDKTKIISDENFAKLFNNQTDLSFENIDSLLSSEDPNCVNVGFELLFMLNVEKQYFDVGRLVEKHFRKISNIRGSDYNSKLIKLRINFENNIGDLSVHSGVHFLNSFWNNKDQEEKKKIQEFRIETAIRSYSDLSNYASDLAFLFYVFPSASIQVNEIDRPEYFLTFSKKNFKQESYDSFVSGLGTNRDRYSPNVDFRDMLAFAYQQVEDKSKLISRIKDYFYKYVEKHIIYSDGDFRIKINYND